MIDTIGLTILILVAIFFVFIWLAFMPFVIISISNNTKRSADESENIRCKLNEIEKELKQLSESLKK